MRVTVFDRTCVRTGGHLSPIWATGSVLYRGLGRIDARCGVASWDEALLWISARPEPITELQYWGHGTWGGARVADDLLDAGALSSAHRLRPSRRFASGSRPMRWSGSARARRSAPGAGSTSRSASRTSSARGSRVTRT